MICETCSTNGLATKNEPAGISGAGDRERLQGIWLAVLANRSGEEADYLTGQRLAFLNDRFVIRGEKGDVIFRGTYRLNADADPPQIDFVHRRDALQGTTWKGVYQLNGNGLRICDNAPDPNGDRPNDLQSRPGSGSVSILFRRL